MRGWLCDDCGVFVPEDEYDHEDVCEAITELDRLRVEDWEIPQLHFPGPTETWWRQQKASLRRKAPKVEVNDVVQTFEIVR